MSAGLIKVVDLMGQVAGGMEIRIQQLEADFQATVERLRDKTARVEVLEAEKESLRKTVEELRSLLEKRADQLASIRSAVRGSCMDDVRDHVLEILAG